jgi:hypothetical protein
MKLINLKLRQTLLQSSKRKREEIRESDKTPMFYFLAPMNYDSSSPEVFSYHALQFHPKVRSHMLSDIPK